jgi:glycosyltransferase involved in cell wall biosynthesis
MDLGEIIIVIPTLNEDIMRISEFRSKHRSAYRILFLVKLIATFRIFADIFEYRRSVFLVKRDMNRENAPKQKINLGPKVSVIVPTKNEEERLPLLLKGIESQTYSNIEVIVADYMSTDRTEQIARKFGAKVMNVPVGSVGHASSTAAKQSSGSIIIRCDADTIFLPEFIEKIVRTFQCNNGIHVILSSHYYYDGNFIINFLSFLYVKYWRPLWMTPGFMTAIRREIYFEVGGYDPQMRRDEDSDLGQRIVRRYGGSHILIDRKLVVLTSARAIKKAGTFSYIMQTGLGKSISFFEQLKASAI